nr:MAG TPA: hypothetical protein [Caudoviricetes sp.]
MRWYYSFLCLIKPLLIYLLLTITLLKSKIPP